MVHKTSGGHIFHIPSGNQHAFPYGFMMEMSVLKKKRTTKETSDAMRVKIGSREFLEAVSDLPQRHKNWWWPRVKVHGALEYGMQRGTVHAA